VVEGFANKLQGKIVGGAAVGENGDLDLDWETPWRGVRRDGIVWAIQPKSMISVCIRLQETQSLP
jgi:hypothetical protein